MADGSLVDIKRGNEGAETVQFKPKNFDLIPLGERRVDLKIDIDIMNSYMKSRLPSNIATNTPPIYDIYFRLNDDLTSLGDHVFTADEKAFLPYAAGFRSQRAPVVCINIPAIWNGLLDSQKNDEGLLQYAYRTMAHEFEHIALFANTELQQRILVNSKYSTDLGKTATLATYLTGFVLTSGLIKHFKENEEENDKMTRRKFLRLSAIASAGLVLTPTWLLAPNMNSIARYINDSQFDSIHRQAYEAENNWKQLEGSIQIVN